MTRYSLKFSLLLLLGIFLIHYSYSQAPKGMSYQSVARKPDGSVLFNQSVNLQFSILDGSPNGAVQYKEQQALPTNQYGMFNAMIGNGTVVLGIFDSIPWSHGNQWIKIEIDPSNTGVYVQMGTVQLLTVPYAFYSEKSGTSVSSGSTPVLKGIINTDGTIAQGSGFSVTHPSDGVYQVTLSTPSTSNPAVIVTPEDTLGSPTLLLTYCVPVHSGTACVSNVSINTLSTVPPACAAPWYHINAASGTNTTSLAAGTGYTINVDCSSSAIVSIWFDWNQDGLLDATEWFQPYTTGTTGSILVPVPVTALNGQTRMRVRSRAVGNINGAVDACTVFGSGSTEDFTVTISGGVPVIPVLILSKVYTSISDVSTSGFTIHTVNNNGLPSDQKFHFTAQ